MPLVVKDRVLETSTTTGTGTLTLAGASTGYQTFSSAIGNGNTTYYAISLNGEWEVGIGTVGAGTLSRDTVLESSNAGSLVNFSAGTKQVFCTYPAEKSVDIDTAQTLTNKTISVDNNTVSGIAASSFVLSNSSGNIDGSASQKAIPSGAVVGTTDTQTLSNKSFASSLAINGSTSGSITLQATAIAGTNTLTLPASTGTVVVTNGAQTVEFADGSASAPSVTNSGDTNTGMFFPAADTIAFAEGGTEQMRLTDTGLLQFNSGYGSVATAYGCRAWVNFNGTGTVAIRGSGNVTSITDNGVGLYTINFTTALPDTNYSTTVGGSLDSFAASASYGIGVYNWATDSVSLACRTEANAYADFQFVTASIHR